MKTQHPKAGYRRLTVDLPEELYIALKTDSAEKNKTMVALLRTLLTERYGVKL